ncbi:hypothetical protein D352_00074 [Enterococcus faecium LA4B-2]|nr:hypothetical protein D352_00074 [Enterococcus faecium LA4B-2]
MTEINNNVKCRLEILQMNYTKKNSAPILLFDSKNKKKKNV